MPCGSRICRPSMKCASGLTDSFSCGSTATVRLLDSQHEHVWRSFAPRFLAFSAVLRASLVLSNLPHDSVGSPAFAPARPGHPASCPSASFRFLNSSKNQKLEPRRGTHSTLSLPPFSHFIASTFRAKADSIIRIESAVLRGSLSQRRLKLDWSIPC